MICGAPIRLPTTNACSRRLFLAFVVTMCPRRANNCSFPFSWSGAVAVEFLSSVPSKSLIRCTYEKLAGFAALCDELYSWRTCNRRKRLFSFGSILTSPGRFFEIASALGRFLSFVCLSLGTYDCASSRGITPIRRSLQARMPHS